MTTPTEQQLRELFAADAAAAPRSGDLAGGALRKVRHRRRVMTRAAGLVAAAVVVGGVVTGVVATRDPAGTGAPSGVAADTAPPTGVGALGGATEDCGPGYSPAYFAERLTGSAFAFDGTVTAIRPGPDLGPEMSTPPAAVTFRVSTWFRGGPAETVTVQMPMPGLDLDSSSSGYGVGTRLLVSGALYPPDGEAHSWSCGFTRYYDEQTATDWAAATE